MQHDVRILTSLEAIAKRAAQEFVQAATTAVSEKGSFSVALSGGSTPKALYSLLANDAALRAQIPWDRMLLYFGDERSVGPDHADSNFRMATEALISKVPLAADQVFRIKGEYKDTERAALEYEQAFRTGLKIAEGQFPRLDLVLMGMGNEGHTASLPAINSAARIMFLITGADKALALKGVLEGPYEPDQLPAQMIQPSNGKLLWLVDTTAGGRLSIGIRE